MERKISLDDIRRALDEAYESIKSLKEGEIDPRNHEAKAGQFGITVTLADGTTLSKGDSEIKSPMADIVKSAPVVGPLVPELSCRTCEEVRPVPHA